MKIKTFDTYWNYSVKAESQVEYYDENKELKISQEKGLLRDFSQVNSGKYSSLTDAIKGFINDEINDFSKLEIHPSNLEEDTNELNRFTITTEVYYDFLGRPINSVFFRSWKNSKNNTLTHAWLTAVFFKHTDELASFEDGKTEIKTDLFLKNKFTNLN